MYIHGYQIHNVLNVYRKQLSEKPQDKIKYRLRSSDNEDHIDISVDGQRKSIKEKISADIIDRISRFGPQTPFDKDIAKQLEQQTKTTEAFTYNLINEKNQKIKTTMEVLGTSQNISKVKKQVQAIADQGFIKKHQKIDEQIDSNGY